MTEFFVSVVNMSISAGWIVLAVLMLRLLLKKAPKWITVLLWGIVAVRLICPFTIESALSLIPSAQTINPEVALNPPAIDSGVPIVDNIVNPVIGGATISFQPEKELNFFKFIMPYLAGLWLVGIAALLIYTVVSYAKLKKKIGTAVLLRDNIFQSESVVSPFVLGIIKPKIYLPFNMNEQDMEHVIAHEQAHIRRKDHWWKPFGFLLLTIHWFNPLMWLGYVLLCRDIELACDEKVIKELNTEQKADYSQALLTCSVNRRMIAACPLAFGEVGVKNRVKSVLNYKKPAFWIILVAIVASVVVAVCFLTNPINTSDKVLNKLINLEDYEVIEQEEKRITLSVPVSELSDKIYTEGGKTFGVKQVMAYQDATTSIYLKEARYSNESEDNLYFCFDFDFDLPKKQGVLLYPYEITNSGLNGSVRTVDGILKADNGEFADAIADRGQGGNELIWFYVSTDTLKQAQGTISFDVLLNEITYFLDGDDYSSISNVGGVDTNNIDAFESTVSYANWTNSSELYTGALNGPVDPTVSITGKVYDLPIYRFDTFADLDNFKQTFGTVLTMDSGYDEVPSFNDATAKYDKSFFENNSLILVYVGANNCTHRFKLAGINHSENRFNVSVQETTNAEVVDTAMAGWFITVTASDDLLNGIHIYDAELYYGLDERPKEDDISSESNGNEHNSNSGYVTEVKSDLNTAIASVLNEKYRAEKPDGLLHIENYYLLANEVASGTPLKGNSGHMEEATVYLLVYHMKYSVSGGQLEEVEGGFVPTAISFKIDENGQYTLKEYWTPRTGANYEKDVLGKFPGESATDVLNTEQYAEDLIKENWRLANEALSKINS